MYWLILSNNSQLLFTDFSLKKTNSAFHIFTLISLIFIFYQKYKIKHLVQ